MAVLLAHDITADRSPLVDRANPDALRNYRTPRANLESVYGGGPVGSPYLYERDGPARLLLGEGGVDVPRNAEGMALLGDPRNDTHLFMNQLQVAFLARPQPARLSAASSRRTQVSPFATGLVRATRAGRQVMSSRRVSPVRAKSRTSAVLTPSRSMSGPEPSPAPPSASATDGSSSRSVSRTASAPSGWSRTDSRRNQTP